MILNRSFYERNDVCLIAKELLGKTLVTEIDGIRCTGKITETEAYDGRKDKACHAFLNKHTKRTEVMYRAGGTAYVYLCYGIHHLFNVVTNREGLADAVLVRAVEPLSGIEAMIERRGLESVEKRMSSGPGTLTQALGITTDNHGHLLTEGRKIWIEDAKTIPHEDVVSTTRIGIDYAGEDALLPWRYYIKTSKWVSKK